MDNGTPHEPNETEATNDAPPVDQAHDEASDESGEGSSSSRSCAAAPAADRREEVVHRPHLLGSREQGEADAARARQDAQPQRLLRRRARPDRERDGERQGPAPHDDPQVLPGLHVRADGPRRPHVPPRQEHAQDHRLPRRHEADAGAASARSRRADATSTEGKAGSPRPASRSSRASPSASSTVRSRTSRPKSKK